MQCRSDASMEGIGTEDNHSPIVEETHDVKSSESAENFQKFIYELFEKNGVLHDLRAYLRGHIVGVLKSAETGNPLTCQKHFTQCLDLPFQALNMLIAEYLLRLEFSYTLSVFVSEIPLANMVFAFAKSLMQNAKRDTSLRFKNEDVWSILNYLGIRCDSVHASNIVEMYGREMQSPLLLCILKCMPLYEEPCADSSQDNLSSSGKSSNSIAKAKSHHSPRDRCRHYVFCKACQSNMKRVKEKYRQKKKKLTQDIKESSAMNLDYVMTNIEVMEKSFIDEMFQQLKSVYETEVEMIKNDEEKRLKRSLATLAMQLQKKRVEMEERFKAREAELERNVQQRKRFLWSLARDLRRQHGAVARAAHRLHGEAARLSAEERGLKSQLAEAARARRRRERLEPEQAKQLSEKTNASNIDTTKEELRAHYDQLAKEFSALRQSLDTTTLEPKRVAERGTITDLADLTTKIGVVLNNGQDVGRHLTDDKLKAKQVVNDLTKQKNVNFSQCKLEEIHPTRSRARSVSAEPASDAASDAAAGAGRLREENERLRTFAAQQREHIDELSSQQARLRAELAAARLPCDAARLPCDAARLSCGAARPPHGTGLPPCGAAARPRTAPAVMPDAKFFIRQHCSASWCNASGGGEQPGGGGAAPPPPHPPPPSPPRDSRRYLINQWCSMRKHVSPARGAAAEGAAAGGGNTCVPGPSARGPSEEDVNNNENTKETGDQRYSPKTERKSNEQRKKTAEKKIKKREKSPICIKRELKHNLNPNQSRPNSPRREKSPNSIIRDAKLRLRKLEIEAEAVEQSYLDFRRRRGAPRGGGNKDTKDMVESSTVEEMDSKPNKSSFKAGDTLTKVSTLLNEETTPATVFGRYIKEYREKHDITRTHSKKTNATCYQVNPVPATFLQLETTTKERKIKNYLETPMAEFRKYYYSEKIERKIEDRPVTITINLEKDSVTAVTESRDNSETRDRVRSPTYININAWNPPTPIVKTRDGNKSSTPIKLETIEGVIGDKSQVNTNNEPDNDVLTVPTNTEIVEGLHDSESDKGMSLIDANSGPIECRTIAKSPINNNQVDVGSNKSPRSPKLTHTGKAKHVGSPKRPKSPKSTYSGNIKDLGSPKKDRDYSKLHTKTSMSTNVAHVKIRSRPQSPKSTSIKSDSGTKSNGAKIDIFRQSKHETATQDADRAKELEILKHNIGKIYNLSEKSAENLNEHFIESVDVAWEETEIKPVGETITEASFSGNSCDLDSKEQHPDKNFLRIELQSVSAVNDVKITESLTRDVMLVVQSPNEDDMSGDPKPTHMTILVSPKRSVSETDIIIKSPKSPNGEKAINMSGHNLVPNDSKSSAQMQLEQSTADHTPGEFEAIEDPDYQDDFSDDVDNFNSPRYDTRSEDIRSPISLPKTSEDDNFWDS